MIDETPEAGDLSAFDSSIRVGPNSYIGPNVIVGKNVSVGARVTITAGPSGASSRTSIEEGVAIGDGAVVSGPLQVGAFAVINPGSIVTKSVPPFAIVEGNPAQVVGYVQPGAIKGEFIEPPAEVGQFLQAVGCDIWRLPKVIDLRGNLTYAEIDQYLPFSPNRFFIVFGVPNEKVRGSHAHHQLHELLVCVHGSVTVTLDNGAECRQLVMNDPTIMLHLRPMTWTTQYNYSSDAVLMVLCSDPYEADDYIRDYDSFLGLTNEQR